MQQSGRANRTEILRRLASAVADDRLFLLYQPILNLASAELDSVEALLRWDDPVIGPVSPDEFIPIAEHTGDIHRIGAWVIDRACLQVREWLDAGTPRLISVNLSPVQLCAGTIADEIRAALSRHGVPARLLEVELTEGATVTDIPGGAAQLKSLIDAGVGVALDDYGTGNSSLATIRNLPLTRIKIDKSLVGDIDTEPFAAAIFGALVQACRTVGLSTTAEGVERESQLKILRDVRCQKAQGYLISCPVPVANLPPVRRSEL